MKRPEIHLNTLRDRQPPRVCPGCGRVLDGATHASGEAEEVPRTMSSGDITICGYCATPLVVTDTGFDRMTEDMVTEMSSKHPQFGVILKVLNRMKEQRT